MIRRTTSAPDSGWRMQVVRPVIYIVVAVLAGLSSLVLPAVADAASTSPILAVPHENQGYLQSLSCTSIAWCLAVGQQQTYSQGAEAVPPLAEMWNGSSWTEIDTSSIASPNGHGPSFEHVSCATPTFCLIVGGGGPAADSTSRVFRWNGQSISSVASLPSSWAMDAISCVSPTYCLASGAHMQYANQFDPVATYGVLAAWDGSHWRRMASPSKFVSSVSCFAVAQCAALGTADAAGHGTTSLDLLHGGTSWKARKVTLEFGDASKFRAEGMRVAGLACRSVTFCVVTGGADSHGRGGYVNGYVARGGFYTPWSGQQTGPTNGSFASPASCGSASDCGLIGQFNHGSGAHQGQYVIRLKGTAWSAHPSPGGYTAYQWSDIWCGNGHCMLVGLSDPGTGTAPPTHPAAAEI
ncbi:hypothetical protein Back2_28960 [Nocardioides baekrokdamisoli]|uniref:Uncharacterized protein n=1 Tax=Nocardioides baekrokdamisoli TaxID=1804624 RepID=A0A3G9J6G5_9ACTN|nr:hypothetical protein [Nocardioides baekrokdamisoli]BBH18609.1 hypothetical protein Back2_28960 [Nocardioides baekrokdamisoli]